MRLVDENTAICATSNGHRLTSKNLRSIADDRLSASGRGLFPVRPDIMESARLFGFSVQG